MAEIIGIHTARSRTAGPSAEQLNGRAADRARPEPLWREVLGAGLRTRREEQGHTLARTATRAGISPQYLSEIERGRKEPSSEMIAAIAGALDTTLTELTRTVTEDLQTSRQAARGVTNCVLLAA